MTGASDLLIYEFPLPGGKELCWWYIADGGVIARGQDVNPRLAGGFDVVDDTDIRSVPDSVIEIALVPSSACVVRAHELDSEVTDKQLLSIAAASAQAASLSTEPLHVAALRVGTRQAASATVSDDVMAHGLAHLQTLGLNPTAVMPSGSILPASDDWVEADFGFERVLRRSDNIVPGEPFAREHIIADAQVTILTGSQVDSCLIGATDVAALNLRSGCFAKKISREMTSRERGIIAGLIAALVIVSIAVPAVQLFQYQRGTDAANQSALKSAFPVVGSFDDAEAAENALDQKLVNESRGNVVLTVPTSALFFALQQAPRVTIETMSYAKDGTVVAGLSAFSNEEINPVLIALQKAGFKVTATPHTDATGKAKANISVRAQ